MNRIYFKIIIILILICFIGCSSTYTIKDFSNKERFYSAFNDFAKDKISKVYLTNQNSLKALEGTKIINDSLFVVVSFQKVGMVMPLNEVKGIEYFGYSSYNIDQSGYIVLKSGEKLKSINIEIQKDSVHFINLVDIVQHEPINNIIKINFSRTGKGIILGVLIGAPLGFLFGGMVYNATESNTTSSAYGTYFFFGGPIVGGLIGGIIGWLYSDCIYEF